MTTNTFEADLNALNIEVNDPTLIKSGTKFKKIFFSITLLLVVSLALSLVVIIHDPANYQEKVNLLLLNKSKINLLTAGSNDDPMPLYFIVFKWFSSFFKSFNLLDARILSLLCYVLSTYFIYLVGSSSFKKVTGKYAAIMLALSPFMIWYSNRATVYAMLVLAVTINAFLFINILKKRYYLLPLFIFFEIVGLALHFVFLTIILSQIIYLLVKRTSLKKTVFLSLILAIIIVLGGFIYWLSVNNKFLYMLRNLPFTAPPSSTNLFIILFQYLFGFQSVVVTTLFIAFWPLLVVVGLLAVQKYIKPTLAIEYLFFSFLLPILSLVVLGLITSPLFLSSYLIVSFPAFIVCVAWLLTAFNLKTLSLGRYLLLGLMAISLLTEILNPNRAIREDYLGNIPIKNRHLTISQTKKYYHI